MADPIDDKPRCFGSNSTLYADYHDSEWGVPVRDDRELFEMLILEGAHAGLSWETILKKREGYREVFHGFDVDRVAAMSDDELNAALQNPAIVRHRQKVPGAKKNAQVFKEMQNEYGSFFKLALGACGRHPDQEPLENHGRCSRRHTTGRDDFQGPQEARHDLRRADNHYMPTCKPSAW